MNSLLLTLPYHSNDFDLLKKCLKWMSELQPETYAPHSCLLVSDFDVSKERKLELRDIAREVFFTAETVVVRVPEQKKGWPLAPNHMFISTARHIAETHKLPWLWFEPDAVPLHPGWLDEICEAYTKCPKKFMGSLIPSDGQADMPPVHLAGCAVYPADAYNALRQFEDTTKAFDIAAANYTVPRAANSPLMQHFWGKFNLPPIFKETKSKGDPENVITMNYITPEAAMFHRCKDGSLIDVLKQRVATIEEQLSGNRPESILTSNEL